jgi:ABC-type branched-subunit amino acid transport system substrate-binding protein
VTLHLRLNKPVVKCLTLLAGVAFLILPYCGDRARAGTQQSSKVQESRGKQIYVQGTSPSGKEILAYIGDSSIEVPASAMPCANCHGIDGMGKPEGGVKPSNLTWEAMTKPYGLVHTDGRQHPPYTERGLELAIARGVDPGGNKLNSVMPRYQMSPQDQADLIAYLKVLGKDRDPGISDNKIVIGTAVPAKGALVEMGQALKAVTAAFFDELNSQGGIYGRRLELKFVETAETPAATRAKIESFLKDEQVFAMIGAIIAGAEGETVPLLAQHEVPLIGPITLYPQTGLPLNRQVFYLLPGADVQARAMVKFAAQKPELKNAGTEVLYPQSAVNTGVFEAIESQSKIDGLSPPRAYTYVAGHFEVVDAVKQVRETKRNLVFFLGNTEEAVSFLNEAEKLNWFPIVVLTGAGGGKAIFDAPVGFEGKIFLTFPASPADQTAEGINEFRALAEKYKLPNQHLATQISAYSAAKILAEVLKRAGRDVSREKVIHELESLYEYPTGLTPSITFGPNRRVGAMGAHVVAIDLKGKRIVPASGWIKVE